MIVRAILQNKSNEIISANADTTIREAMDLMISHSVGCLPVCDDDGKIVGIVSDKDIFKEIHRRASDFGDIQVSSIMTKKVIVGVPEDEIAYIAGVMDKNWIRHVPIVDGEKLVGLLSLRDISKVLAQHRDIENRYLNMYLDGMHHRDQSGD